MGNIMNIGDVIYNSDHVFLDGGHADKIFIIISDPSKDNIVMVIVTSHGKDNKNKGCQPTPKKFFFKKDECGFDKDTWVDLARNIRAYDTAETLAAIENKKTNVLSTLPQQKLNELLNCLKKHALESLTREACNILGFKPKW